MTTVAASPLLLFGPFRGEADAPARCFWELGKPSDLIENPEDGGVMSGELATLLGRVYVTRFASAEGRNGGQFYTPDCVARCLVEMLAPSKGRIHDPVCGSGGMFVESEKFAGLHDGRLGDISTYSQESNATIRRPAAMNLTQRGIKADFGPKHADTHRRTRQSSLRAIRIYEGRP
jgi:type I restriction enzyme M protein